MPKFCEKLNKNPIFLILHFNIKILWLIQTINIPAYWYCMKKKIYIYVYYEICYCVRGNAVLYRIVVQGKALVML